MPDLTHKPWYDPQTGALLLDEYIVDRHAFQALLQTGTATDADVAQQAHRVIEALKQLETVLNPEAKALATDVLCELAVLHALQNHRQPAA